MMSRVRFGDCVWHLVANGRACGGIGVIDGVVRDACPYFRFLIGSRFDEIGRRGVSVVK